MMPWDDIPDSNVFPTGNYHVEGVSMEERESSTGKVMFAYEVVVKEHPATAPFTNMHFFENLVIGTEDDPQAEVPGTWMKGFGIKMKQLIGAAQITEHRDVDKQCAMFPGTQFVIAIQEYKEPDKTRDGQDNPYAGQARNKATKFFKVGQKEPSLEKTIAAPVAAPAAVAPQAPPVQPAPVAPAAPQVPVPPPVTPAPAATGQMLQCNVCGVTVPAPEYAAHISACMAKQGG
jgi:hypothetical protein